jgi:hypothetical protein
VIEHRARVFAITSQGRLSKWDQLEIAVARWRDIERLARTSCRFISALTYTTVRR